MTSVSGRYRCAGAGQGQQSVRILVNVMHVSGVSDGE